MMIKNTMHEGKLVPSELIVKLLLKAMLQSGNDKFLVDGFPRNEENRQAYDSIVRFPFFSFFFSKCRLTLLHKKNVWLLHQKSMTLTCRYFGFKRCISHTCTSSLCSNVVLCPFDFVVCPCYQISIEPEFVLFIDCPKEEMERRILNRNQVSF